MKKMLLAFSFLVVCAGALLLRTSPKTGITVGVIVPMQHEALTQIVNGLKEELSRSTDQPVTVKVLNAQGDPNIQRAIIEKLVQDKCDLLVSIGTTTSQMTLNLAKDRKVLCLAADLGVISSRNNMQATALDDELSPRDAIAALHTALPRIKKISLLYSSSEKIAKDIAVVADEARLRGIEVEQFRVQSMAELYTMSQAISRQSEAIFILKDHLLVSGIQTLAQQAEKRGIPLVTSDEGSVVSGASFALGVKESSIGKQGALMARKILNGATVPPETMKGPFPLFVNRSACIKQGIDVHAMMERIQEAGIPIQYVDVEGGL